MASPTSRTPLDARTPLGTGKAGPHTTLIRKPVLPSHHFYFIPSQNKILCPSFCWAEFNSHASNQAASKVENNWNSEIPQIGRLSVVVLWSQGVDNVLKHMILKRTHHPVQIRTLRASLIDGDDWCLLYQYQYQSSHIEFKVLQCLHWSEKPSAESAGCNLL